MNSIKPPIIKSAALCLLILMFDGNYAQVIDNPAKSRLEAKIAITKIIVEGTVLDTKSFKNPSGSIYTSALVQITRIFKGHISDSTFEFIYTGGQVGDEFQYISDGQYSTKTGHEAIYFLDSNQTDTHLRSGVTSYVFKSYPIEYYHDGFNHRAIVSIHEYCDDLEKELYPRIEAATHIPMQVLRPNLFEIEAAKKAKSINSKQ